MVSIAAFQAVDPGSIPGHRKFFILTYFIKYLKYVNVFILLSTPICNKLNDIIKTALDRETA